MQPTGVLHWLWILLAGFSVGQTQLRLATDTWVAATWDEYLEQLEDPTCEKAKSYYHRGHMRIEMLPVGFDHADNHFIISFALGLFAMVRGLPLKGLDNCTFRKAGLQDSQPDLAFYVGERARLIPRGTNIVDLDRYPPPDLAIEISKTTIVDDLGSKRHLFEALGVKEYWVVDVERAEIVAYGIQAGGSLRIERSQVLEGLEIAVLEEALRRSQETDQSVVGAWLMEQFQQ